MSPEEQRRWVWFQQAVDAVAAILGLVTGAVMLLDNSWSYQGVAFALICLGKISSTQFLKTLVERWDK